MSDEQHPGHSQSTAATGADDIVESEPSGSRQRRSRLTVAAAAVALLLVTMLLLSRCGGGTPDSNTDAQPAADATGSTASEAGGNAGGDGEGSAVSSDSGASAADDGADSAGSDGQGESSDTDDGGETSTAVTQPPDPEFIPETADGRPFLELSLTERIDAFLARPNEAFAENVSAEMGLTGEQRWAPWLLDLMRLGGSRGIINATTWALQTISGIESSGDFNEDFVTYGSWSRGERIDPGQGYPEWKSTNLRWVEAGYEDLLADFGENPADRIQLAAIQWGGVRRGGIPELNNPPKVTAAQAAELSPPMTDEELVLGVVIGGEAVAYPLRFMARHELANDVVGGVPVALGYCTLCRTGLMFDRRVDGEVLTFKTSGLLADSNKVMVDNETDSLWQHLSGEAIAGPHTGAVLETFPMVTMRWADWLAEHPETVTLDTPEPTFFPTMPERPPVVYNYTPGTAYANYYGSAQLWFPTTPAPDFWELKQGVVTLTAADGSAAAFRVEDVEAEPPFAYALGDELFVVVGNTGGARVYSGGPRSSPTSQLLEADLYPGSVRKLGADVTSAEAASTASLALSDGTELPRVVSGQSFWFAWWGLHPDTRVWPAPS